MFKRANSSGYGGHQRQLANAHIRRERLESGQLEDHFYKLFKSQQFCDIVIRCPKNIIDENYRSGNTLSGTVEFNVHKCVLAARSSVFAAMLRNTANREVQQNVIDVPDIHASVMEALLEFVYAGTCPRDTLSMLAADLLVAADKYDLGTLKEACSYELFIQLTPDNVTSCLILADQHSASGLRANAKTFIIHRSGAVRNSENWQLLRSQPELMWEVLNECLVEKSKLDVARLHEHSRLRTQRSRHKAAVPNIGQRLIIRTSSPPFVKLTPQQLVDEPPSLYGQSNSISSPLNNSAGKKNADCAASAPTQQEVMAEIGNERRKSLLTAAIAAARKSTTKNQGLSCSVNESSLETLRNKSIFLRPSAPFRLLRTALQQANNNLQPTDNAVDSYDGKEELKENNFRQNRDSSGSSTSESHDDDEDDNNRANDEEDDVSEEVLALCRDEEGYNKDDTEILSVSSAHENRVSREHEQGEDQLRKYKNPDQLREENEVEGSTPGQPSK